MTLSSCVAISPSAIPEDMALASCPRRPRCLPGPFARRCSARIPEPGAGCPARSLGYAEPDGDLRRPGPRVWRGGPARQFPHRLGLAGWSHRSRRPVPRTRSLLARRLVKLRTGSPFTPRRATPRSGTAAAAALSRSAPLGAAGKARGGHRPAPGRLAEAYGRPKCLTRRWRIPAADLTPAIRVWVCGSTPTPTPRSLASSIPPRATPPARCRGTPGPEAPGIFARRRLLRRIAGADGLLPETGSLRLGGDGRGAHFQPWLWQPPAPPSTPSPSLAFA